MAKYENRASYLEEKYKVMSCWSVELKVARHKEVGCCIKCQV
jgi:hypothetical protein